MLIKKFQTSLIAAVTVLYEENPSACVLHREESYLKQLREMRDLDTEYSSWSKYMRFDNNDSFNQGTDEKPSTIRGTICLGSRTDIRKLVATCQTDLMLKSGISV